MTKYILILGIVGHILCGVTDCLLSYDKKGRRLDLKSVKDAGKMREELAELPEKFPLVSMVLGTFSITAFAFAYFELCSWAGGSSSVCGIIMYIGAVLFVVPIVTHHVFCGAVEWFYVKLGRTDEAREAVLSFQKQTISTMFAGYLGLAVFGAALFVLIVSGKTPLPAWGCVFNTIPAMIVLAPTKLPAKGNIAGAVMFSGLFVLMMIFA